MCQSKYSSITVGTEQELSKVFLVISKEGSSGQKGGSMNNSKVIASIYNGSEQLVNVTADTLVEENDTFEKHQLEFSTTKAGIDDVTAWNQRKEAIKLFVEEIVLQEQMVSYTASAFRQEICGKYATYTCTGNANDNRIFYFVRESAASFTVRFSSQLTIGIKEADLLNEFKMNTLNDRHMWDMLWMKNCWDEIKDLQDPDNPSQTVPITDEENFLYSYICSVFDYSVDVYIRSHPDNATFVYDRWYKHRNSSYEKNMWHVLPRTMVSPLLKRLETMNPNVYEYFKERKYNNETDIVDTKKHVVYETMAGYFWKQYNANEFYEADIVLRAGVIVTGDDYFLFEYRSVLNNIPGIYADSGKYIYRPNSQAV